MGLEPGETFGRYTIEATVGTGGMGLVLRAHDNVLDRKVALKIIRPERQDKEEAVARFFREARLTARLTHPNTIRVYDLGEIEQTPFIAMEYLEGQPLTVFAGQRDVPVAKRVRWMLGIASGLEAAHAIGLVHRDVKLANMMITTDDIPKVLDFGLAKRRETTPNLRATFKTQLGFVVGTPMYMAPEQIEGKEADPRSDQFAWGLAAYILLSGRNPRAIDPLLLSKVTPLDAIVPDLDANIAAVVGQSLQRDPKQRFPTMTVLIAALGEALRDVPPAPLPRSAAVLIPPVVTSGRPFYCPGCATRLDEERRCPRCGFVGNKPKVPDAPPKRAEPPVVLWKIVPVGAPCPFTPRVAAISRDGARLTVFGDRAARRDGVSWTMLDLPPNVDPSHVRCLHYDFDGSVVVGGAKGLAGRVRSDGSFVRFPLGPHLAEVTLTACTTSPSGRVTFVGQNRPHGIVVHANADGTTAFTSPLPLTCVARRRSDAATYAAGSGRLYLVHDDRVDLVFPKDIGATRAMVASKDELFVSGSTNAVFRFESKQRFSEETIENPHDALTLLTSSSAGVWGLSTLGRLHRREGIVWRRVPALPDPIEAIAFRMIGEEIIALLVDGKVVTTAREDTKKIPQNPPPAGGDPSP